VARSRSSAGAKIVLVGVEISSSFLRWGYKWSSCAQFLYLIAHRRESAVAAWFSISRLLSERESSRFVSTSQLNA
jgi:hypothetical protein